MLTIAGFTINGEHHEYDTDEEMLTDRLILRDILDEVSWRFEKGDRLFTIIIDPKWDE